MPLPACGVSKRMTFAAVFSFLMIVIFLSVTGCRKEIGVDHFILITLDTQRADHLSSYSPDHAHTPNLDLLADDGMLFENAFSLIPITLPAHASIFFSEPPHKVKNYTNGQIIRRKRSRPSFVNLFKKEGFTTAAFVSLGVLKSKFGLDEAFDFYYDDFPRGRWYLHAEEVNSRVFSWLEEHRKEKNFLWIHYSDPHDPYAPPDMPNDFRVHFNGELVDEYCLSSYKTFELDFDLKTGENRIILEVTNEYEDDPDYFQARLDKLEFSPEPFENDIDIHLSRGWFIRRDESIFFFKEQGFIDIYNHREPRRLTLTFRGKLLIPLEGIRKNYRKEVEYMDREIGKLLDKLKDLGLFHKTAVLVVGDHGEGLGEYRNIFGDLHIGHIHFLYNVYMKVPLIIYHPFLPQKGTRINEPVTLLDVAPTISHIMGFKKMPHFQGRNLFQLKEGENRPIYEETYRPESVRDRFGIRRDPWHFIFTPEDSQFELFHLRDDPDERENIYRDRDLPPEVIELKQKVEVFAREVLRGKEDIPIDKNTEEMLRALGYIR